MNFEIRYWSLNYEWLCLKHAIQEAMRGEDVFSQIVEHIKPCRLCIMVEQNKEGALDPWYEKYVSTIKEKEASNERKQD